MSDETSNTEVQSTDTPQEAVTDASAKPKRTRKPAAKKATSGGGKKKAVAKKAASKSTLAPEMVEKFDDAFKRWRKGERICDLAGEIGCRRGALRRQLRKRAKAKGADGKEITGRAAFKALRNQGAGGEKAVHGARAKSASLDSGALVVTAEQRKKEKWGSRWVTLENKNRDRIPLMVAKGGIEYRPAKATEKADILAEMGNGLPPARMVVYATAHGKTEA